MRLKDKQAEFIDVADLKIGHYIYLDVGWMGHPFALNSFRISSPDQIATIKSLGLERLRYSPAQSRVEAEVIALAGSDMPELAESVAVADTATVATSANAESVPGDSPNQPASAAAAGSPAAAEARTQPDLAPVRSEVDAKEQRRELIASQREALQRCENQFNAAAHSYRAIVTGMHGKPEEARKRGEEVVDGMISQMGGGEEEILVRLLSEKAGERTSLHSINVSIVSLLLAKAVGCTPEQMHDIGLGALLHDIGKMELPDRVRWHDHLTNDADRAEYRGHVAKGVLIAQKMGLPDGAKLVIAQHHEMTDGSGFPRGLKDDKIALPARIVALVNRYDNLCNPGNPAQAVTPHEALSLIYAQNRAHFDARIMAVFIRLMGVYPPGSVIELSTGQHALVVSVNSARPLRPNVLVHDPAVPANEAVIVNLEQCPEIGIRRSLKPLQLPKVAFDYLSPRKRLCYFFERGAEPGAAQASHAA